MAGLKEIESRLRSVQNTKKITYAMKLVAAAKLRKAQDAVQRARVYTDALSALLTELRAASSNSSATEESHPLLTKREKVKSVRLVVVGGSRGLCGGYNGNLHRKVDAAYREIEARYPGVSISATVIGRKPAEYFRRVNRPYVAAYEDLLEDPLRWPIDDIARSIEQEFIDGTIDEVYVVFTRFKSAMSQTPTIEKVLPIEADELLSSGAVASSSAVTADATEATSRGDAIFEPSAKAVWEAILPRIMRTKFLQAGLDAKASETGSRMTAMDAATKNAGELIHSLTRLRNKLRQGRITSQLLDILGGAEATS